MARGAFLTHGARALEAAQSLGLGPWAGLFRVAVPLARPWLAGGAALVAMETLADFGAVSVFNYDTFTTAIYKAWFGLFSIETALGLALLLLVFVAVALAARALRAAVRAFPAADAGCARAGAARASRRARLVRLRLRRRPSSRSASCCRHRARALGLERRADRSRRALPGYILRTLGLAGMAALACLALALVLGYATRAADGVVSRTARARDARLCGARHRARGRVVSALGAVDDRLRAFAGGEGLWLQGTVFALLLGYVARFLAVAHGPVLGGFARIRSVARGSGAPLGSRRRSRLAPAPAAARRRRWHGAMLVFVDVMKEMPITLMTRPFGWDTLAVRVFEMTAEGEWERAALPSLAIVVAGLLPVALLTWRMERAARAA